MSIQIILLILHQNLISNRTKLIKTMEGTIALTKEQIAKRLKKLAAKFPQDERMKYAIQNDMSFSSVNNYLRGSVGSAIIGKHLIDHIESLAK